MGSRTSSESRWGALLERGGGLVGRRGSKEVSRGSLLKQALDARERGNLPAAFWLLDEAHRKHPDAEDVCMAFWDVAVDWGRPLDAVGAVTGLIEQHVEQGRVELACQYWYELVALGTDALARPVALARLLRPLQQKLEQAHDDKERAQKSAALVQALRAIVDERNEGLTTNLAFRVADLAQELDPVCALAAARFCLASDGLHDAKRDRLCEVVRLLDPEASRGECVVEVPALTSGVSAGRPTDRSPTEFSSPDSARNHPLRETEGPAYAPLTPDQLGTCELPPIRGSEAQREAGAGDEVEPLDRPFEPFLEAEILTDPEPDAWPEELLEADIIDD